MSEYSHTSDTGASSACCVSKRFGATKDRAMSASTEHCYNTVTSPLQDCYNQYGPFGMKNAVWPAQA